MKSFRPLLATCVVAALAAVPTLSFAELWGQKPQVMPVVVQVNAQGRVTSINPAMTLKPWVRKLLIKQIDAWITGPLTVNGRAVGSQFIIEVAMRTEPTSDGQYNASFVYVKSLPVAYAGPQHWNVINGGLQFALVPNNLQQPAGIGPQIQAATVYEPTMPGYGNASNPVPPVANPSAAGATAGGAHVGKP